MKSLSIYSIIVLWAFYLSSAFAANPVSGVNGALTVRNSIIYNDSSFNQTGTTTTVLYCAVRAGFAPATNNNIAFSNTGYKDSGAQPAFADSYYLSPTSTLLNTGTTYTNSSSKDINGNPRIYYNTPDIGAIEYSLIHNLQDTTWEHQAGWNIGRIPANADIVTIETPTSVTSNAAICKNLLSIGTNGILRINTGTTLNVTNKITNNDPDKIRIRANNTASNGTLIFHNPSDQPVQATVEMYSPAYITNSTDPNTKYKWQFFGIPLRNVVASASFEGSWVRKWNETSSEYTKWEQLASKSTLQPFAGYEITQQNPKTVTFSGSLLNNDTTLILNKSNVPYYSGQHVLSNPYTAGIRIESLVFGENTDKTVYIYKTGSYTDWNNNTNPAKLGDGNGQYLSVPVNVASLIQPEIPSMQGFLIRALANSATFTIPYSSVTTTQSRQRVKTEAILPNISLDVKSTHASSRIWLIESENTSHSFDNGWDGMFIHTDEKGVEFFVSESNGDYQVSTTNSISGTTIAFRAGTDTDYHLEVCNHTNNDSLYLLDLLENKWTKLSSDTTYINFESSDNEKATARFRIMSSITQDESSSEQLLRATSMNSYITINNATASGGNYTLSDITGRMIASGNLKNDLFTTFRAPVLKGFYILYAKAGNSVLKSTLYINPNQNL